MTHVVRLEDREKVGLETAIDEVLDAPVLLVGEYHTVPAHHRLQLEVIERLYRQGKPVAIGLEMFEAPSQRMLDGWVAGKVPTATFVKVYRSNWRNLPWGLYKDIFFFAREHGIPMVALNAPRAVVEQVSLYGFESLKEAQIAKLPPGVVGEVSDDYLKFVAASYPTHGRKGDDFRYICEAQMLRNRHMAQRIAQFLMKNPERTMVVLAGAGHARRRGGIPMELQLPRTRCRVFLPGIPGVSAATVTVQDADYFVLEPLLGWLF